MREDWRRVPGAEDRYIVSNMGRVASNYDHGKCTRQRDDAVPEGYYLMKQSTTATGYKRVYMKFGAKRTAKLVHRLVMEAFVGQSIQEINHINENKLDNRITNLEYVSSGKNHLHSFGHPVERIYPDSGKVAAIYSSLKAAKEDGYNGTSIINACNGDCDRYKGFIWRYHDEFRRFYQNPIDECIGM